MYECEHVKPAKCQLNTRNSSVEEETFTNQSRNWKYSLMPRVACGVVYCVACGVCVCVCVQVTPKSMSLCVPEKKSKEAAKARENIGEMQNPLWSLKTETETNCKCVCVLMCVCVCMSHGQKRFAISYEKLFAFEVA